jgi:3-methyladenine DNA glycosylase/8-oxoguanine DNA glycosylase
MDLSSKILSNDLSLENICRLGDEEVIVELLRIKGIGRGLLKCF